MIAMDDFTKIEVDKIFPGPVPDQEGVQIELWHDKLTVLIQMPELDRDQLIPAATPEKIPAPFPRG